MAGIDDTVVLVGNGPKQDGLDSGSEAHLDKRLMMFSWNLGMRKEQFLQRNVWIYLQFGLADHLTTVGVHGELKRQSVQVL